MVKFNPIRKMPQKVNFKKGNTLVVFGEVFSRGYVNGIIEMAENAGMKVIYSTVGRREKDNTLRALTPEEIQEKNQSPLINVPLEAGFDLDPSAQGITPCDQISSVKLSDWQNVNIDWQQVNESMQAGRHRFKNSLTQYFAQLEPHLSLNSNVYFVHTMAGGVPRAKIIMPMMNRVFKGYGDRYLSSLEFWNSELGKLCEKSFNFVTADTFQHLIEESSPLRSKIEKAGGQVRYLAYGYHGNELFNGNQYVWQSYAPYLQGFAKKQLEQYAIQAQKQNIKAQVFNVPEILTNSSSIFLGIEVALYPLLNALHHQNASHPKVKELIQVSSKLLKEEHKIEDVFKITNNYFTNKIISKDWSQFEAWPQHNGPEQMQLMRETSQNILNMHISEKNLLTSELSELVFKSCGYYMLYSGINELHDPVYWIGHDQVCNWFLN